MDSVILLRHLKVHAANAITGFTWGFPAMTHFLGYTTPCNAGCRKSSPSVLTAAGLCVIGIRSTPTNPRPMPTLVSH